MNFRKGSEYSILSLSDFEMRRVWVGENKGDRIGVFDMDSKVHVRPPEGIGFKELGSSWH